MITAKMVSIDFDSVMSNRSTFNEAFALYKELFNEKLPKKPQDMSEKQADSFIKFITGYKIGREVGTKVGEDNNAAIMFV